MAHSNVNILIAVDTQQVLSHPGTSSPTVYMSDDNPSGSTSEGTRELNTMANTGGTINWYVTAINQTDEVTIIGYRNSDGDVFGFNPPTPNGTNRMEGVVGNTGNETYQLEILVNGVATATWDPYITVPS